MALKPYLDVLQGGREEAEKSLAEPRANEMKQKALLEISKLAIKIAEAESKLAEQSSRYPVDFDALVKAHDDVALAARRKGQLEKFVAEMFPAAA